MDRAIIEIYHRKQRQNAQQRRKKKENIFENFQIFHKKAYLVTKCEQIHGLHMKWIEYPTPPNLNVALSSMRIKNTTQREEKNDITQNWSDLHKHESKGIYKTS